MPQGVGCRRKIEPVRYLPMPNWPEDVLREVVYLLVRRSDIEVHEIKIGGDAYEAADLLGTPPNAVVPLRAASSATGGGVTRPRAHATRRSDTAAGARYAAE
jgi:hypothetical protein